MVFILPALANGSGTEWLQEIQNSYQQKKPLNRAVCGLI